MPSIRPSKPKSDEKTLPCGNESLRKEHSYITERDTDGNLKYPFEAAVISVQEHLSSFECLATSHFETGGQWTKPNTTSDRSAERDFALAKASIEYRLFKKGDLSETPPNTQAEYMELATDLAHMYIELDVMFFLRHGVSLKSMDRMIIPRHYRRNSPQYNFIEKRLLARINSMCDLQIHCYKTLLDQFLGPGCGREDWATESWEDRFKWLKCAWDCNPLMAAGITERGVNEVVAIDAMVLAPRNNKNARRWYTFSKAKFLVASRCMFPYLFGLAGELTEAEAYKRAKRIYHRIPSCKLVKKYRDEVGCEAHVPIREWVVDVRQSRLFGLKNAFVFEERDKIQKANAKTNANVFGGATQRQVLAKLQ